MHSCSPCWTLIHLVLSCRSSTRARIRGRGKATFSFKASVCSGRRLLWLIQQPGRPHLIPFKTRLSESHMHIICMRHDALASQAPDAFFRAMNVILWLWRQARKISMFTRFVSVPYTGKDLMDGRDGCVSCPAVSSNTHFAVLNRGKVSQFQFQLCLVLSHECRRSVVNSSPVKNNIALKVSFHTLLWSVSRLFFFLCTLTLNHINSTPL